MRTIKFANTESSNSVKKILVNRSRSGLLTPLKKNLGPISTRVFVSPDNRTNIGFKNIDSQLIKDKKSVIVAKLPQDYFNKQDTTNYKEKTSKHTLNKKSKNNFPYHEGKQNQNDHDNKEEKTEKSNSTYENTDGSSKFSNEIETPQTTQQSQYFNSGYLSPRIKLRNLQRQRNQQKFRWLKNLDKVIKVDKQIEEDRMKNKLEIQIYQQIIKKLKQKRRSSRSESMLNEKNLEISKKSSNTQTQVGQSSNEYLNLSINSLSNCSQV